MHIGAHLPDHVNGEVEQVLFGGLGGEGVFKAFIGTTLREDGETGIFAAVKQGDVEKVKQLLDEDASLLDAKPEGATFRTDYRATPLILAAKWGQLHVVEVLVGRGAEINATNGCSYTALQHAARHGQADMVALLLRHGAEARVRDSLHATPLINAANQGHLGVVQTLARHVGQEGLDDVDMDHATALYKASDRGHGEVVRALLLAGADRRLRSSHRHTPRQAAEAQHHQHVVDIFQVRQAGRGLFCVVSAH